MIESYDTPGVIALRGDERRRHADLPGTGPDGLALCYDGALLWPASSRTASTGPRGGGEAEVVLDDWRGLMVLTPTNVAYYAPGPTRLAVASLGGWRVCTAETPWSGQPAHPPETR